MISEFELIRRFFSHPVRNAVLGVGDDAAIVRVARGCALVVSTDLLVAGRHFASDIAPDDLGHKALAVNLSDMAAMAATPRWATLALALPTADPRWLSGFSRGFMRLARRFNVDLIGGDTTRGPLDLCVQIMGEVPRGTALRRDGARPGDDVWVSGTLGDAALALSARKRRIRLKPAELERCAVRLHRPQPRVALGLALRGVAHSAIDVSDGLAADLGHILERSHVAAEIDFAALPVSPILHRYLDRAITRAAVLSGGDDYELCFTAPPRARGEIRRISGHLRINLSCIGRILRLRRGKPALSMLGPDKRPLSMPRAGFDHFA